MGSGENLGAVDMLLPLASVAVVLLGLLLRRIFAWTKLPKEQREISSPVAAPFSSYEEYREAIATTSVDGWLARVHATPRHILRPNKEKRGLTLQKILQKSEECARKTAEVMRGYTDYSPSGVSGFSGYRGSSGMAGVSGFSGYRGSSGMAGVSGFSGYSGSAGPEVKLGAWYRHKSSGILWYLERLAPDNERIGHFCGDGIWRTTSIPFEAMELAMPKVGETWEYKRCPMHGYAYPLRNIGAGDPVMLSSNEEVVRALVSCGCLIPSNFGRGEFPK